MTLSGSEFQSVIILWLSMCWLSLMWIVASGCKKILSAYHTSPNSTRFSVMQQWPGKKPGWESLNNFLSIMWFTVISYEWFHNLANDRCQVYRSKIPCICLSDLLKMTPNRWTNVGAVSLNTLSWNPSGPVALLGLSLNNLFSIIWEGEGECSHLAMISLRSF